MPYRRVLPCPARAALLATLLLLPAVARTQSPPQNQFRMTALRAEPGKASVYELAFELDQALAPEAVFVFEFPPEFDLSQLAIAGSPEIDGGFRVTRDKHMVRVQRAGLGRQVRAGTEMRLHLGMVMNPETLPREAQIGVQIQPAAALPLAPVATCRLQFELLQQTGTAVSPN